MGGAPSRILKRFILPKGHCLELLARHDGAFQFQERSFEAGSYDGEAAFL